MFWYAPNRGFKDSYFLGTDFCAPPVLGGAALSDNSAPAAYKIQGP